MPLISFGSYRLRPSKITELLSVAFIMAKSGLRNSFHSVTMIASPLTVISYSEAFQIRKLKFGVDDSDDQNLVGSDARVEFCRQHFQTGSELGAF
jgi:hypothetical protein